VDLDTYDIKTILVDPPRAGLDSASLELTKKYDEIVYISCNPAKLNAELASFEDHKIVSAALFDQVVLTRATRTRTHKHMDKITHTRSFLGPHFRSGDLVWNVTTIERAQSTTSGWCGVRALGCGGLLW
jgi:hypothetical protein